MTEANWGRNGQYAQAHPDAYPHPQTQQGYAQPQPGYYGDHPATHAPQPHQATGGGRIVRNEPPMQASRAQPQAAHAQQPYYAQQPAAHHPQQPIAASRQPHQQAAQAPSYGQYAQSAQPQQGYAGHPPQAPQYAEQPMPVAARDEASLGVTRVLNGAGALLSIALVGGLAVWGYNLAMRDVTEVPVVAALEGAMRVAPENPGGLDAEHQGLAVNSVAAEGIAEGPADQVMLAPPVEDLTEEDAPVVAAASLNATPNAEADEFRPEDEMIAQPVAVSADEARAEGEELAAQIAGDAEPLTAEEVAIAAATASVTGNKGVAISPRPKARPADLVTRASAQPSTDALLAATQEATTEVNAADLPAGTRLVQLGAYDTEDVARAEWDQLAGQFDDYMGGKSRVIEKATSGGKTFYRLRAMGFDDLSDARRFCAALMAGQAACIPVVTR